MRIEFYWPNVKNDVYGTLSDCSQWAAPQDWELISLTPSTIIPGEWSIGVCHNGYPDTIYENCKRQLFCTVISHPYAMIIRAVPMSKITMSHIASLSTVTRIEPCGIPTHVLTDSWCSSSVGSLSGFG